MIAAAFPLVRPLLHRLDAERAHDLTLAALALLPAGPRPADDPRLAVDLLGRRFPNPVGLAAGFDKGARVPDAPSSSTWNQPVPRVRTTPRAPMVAWTAGRGSRPSSGSTTTTRVPPRTAGRAASRALAAASRSRSAAMRASSFSW